MNNIYTLLSLTKSSKIHFSKFHSIFTKLTLLMIVVIISISSAWSATITSKVSGGNWSATSTWEGDVIPGNSDDVIITDASTIVVDSDITVTSLTITSGKLNIGAYNLINLGGFSGISEFNYILTSGNGKLHTAISDSAMLPIGTNSSFAPFYFTGFTQTDSISGHVNNSISDTPYNLNSCVQLEWTISEKYSGSNTGMLNFQWNISDQGTEFNPDKPVFLRAKNGFSYTYYLVSISGTGPFTASLSVPSDLNGTFILGNFPDLNISNYSVQTSINQGETVPISYRVNNIGSVAISNTTFVQYYLSTDNILDVTDTYIGSNTIGTIGANSYRGINSTVRIPSNTNPGEWYLFVKVDGANIIDEMVENNNTNYTQITVDVVYDFTISNLSVIPTEIDQGETVPVTFTVNNDGTSSISSTTYVYYYLSMDNSLDGSDTYIGSQTIGGIKANSSRDFSSSLRIPISTNPGDWYLFAKADGSNIISETHEINNNDSILISVNANYDLSLSNLSVTPTNIDQGETVPVNFTVNNSGTSPISSTSYIYYFLSADNLLDGTDKFIGTQTIGGVDANSSRNFSSSLRIPISTNSGDWYLFAKTDGSDFFTETNENNNNDSIFITVNELPTVIDLTISDLTIIPSSINQGETVPISYRVNNLGTTSNKDYSFVYYYLSADNILDGGDTYIGSKTVGGIKSESYRGINSTIRIPRYINAGTWFVLADADGSNLISESNELNNYTFFQITVIAAPSKSMSYSSKKNEITIEDESLSFKSNVFPNPTLDFINLSISGNKSVSGEYFIYDISGKLVKSENLILKEGNNLISIDMQNFNDGTYMILLRTDEIQKNFKILKQ